MAVHHVLVFVVVVFLAIADGPAAIFPVTFAPPPVQHADVQHAVQGRLHARGAAGLHGPTGGIEPDIGALDQIAGDVHVVVLDKQEPVTQVGAPPEIHQAADDPLAFVVLGMGLAGKNELHRMVFRIDEGFQPVRIL